MIYEEVHAAFGQEVAELSIRDMRHDDIGRVIALISGEGWGYTRVDLQRMLAISPSGSFIWESEGAVRGVVTSIMCGSTASLGHLVISRESRGKNIGRRLLEHFLDHVDSAGVRSTILYATEQGSRLYEQYGFRVTHKTIAVGVLVSDSARRGMQVRCELVSEHDLSDVCAVDREMFGDDREVLLRRLHSEFPEHCFKLEKEEGPVGFAFGRRTPIGFDIGPWVCSTGSLDDARALLTSVMGSFPGGGRIDVSPFADNEGALEVLDGYHRYRRAEPVGLMVRGDDRYVSRRGEIFSVAGLEVG